MAAASRQAAALGALAAVAAAALVAAAPAGAAAPWFGSQVLMGDSDYDPLVKSNAIRLSVVELDLGVPGVATDNCLYLDAGTTVGTLQVKDLRLVPCVGKALGSALADADAVEKNSPVAGVYRGAFITGLPNAADVVVDPAGGATLFAWMADTNGNSKYDKGDPVYLSTDGTLPVAPTTGTGMWTIRLTPGGGKEAGTFVQIGDTDISQYGGALLAMTSGLSGIVGCPGLGSSTNTPAFANQQMCTGLTLVEREGMGWYVVPFAMPPSAITTAWAALTTNTGYDANNELWSLFFNGAVLRSGEIPANSIRVSEKAPALDVKATKISVRPAQPAAGGAFTATVDLKNNGKVGGTATVTSKLGSDVVDVRLAPWLKPGENMTLVLSLPSAAEPGTVALAVNGLSQNVTFVENPLAAKVRDLEGRLATLQGAPAAQAAQAAQGSAAKPAAVATPFPPYTSGGPAPAQSTPFLPLAWVLVGLAAALVARRGGAFRGR